MGTAIITAFVLMVVSSNGTVTMQQFDDAAACKTAAGFVAWDGDRKDFRRGISEVKCLPRATAASEAK